MYNLYQGMMFQCATEMCGCVNRCKRFRTSFNFAPFCKLNRMHFEAWLNGKKHMTMITTTAHWLLMMAVG